MLAAVASAGNSFHSLMALWRKENCLYCVRHWGRVSCLLCTLTVWKWLESAAEYGGVDQVVFDLPQQISFKIGLESIESCSVPNVNDLGRCFGSDRCL